MKKLLVLSLTLVLALALAACGGGSYKDGTYTAQLSEASYGWTDQLTVTYQGGAITEVDYDALDAEGTRKSTPGAYEMDPPPTEWIPQINENIKAAGSADKFESVAGATNSSNNAKALLKAIEEKAKAGDTATAMVEPAA